MDNSLGLDVNGATNEPPAPSESEAAESTADKKWGVDLTDGTTEESVQWGVDLSNNSWGVENNSWDTPSADWGGATEDAAESSEAPVSTDKSKSEGKGKLGEKIKKEWKPHSKPYVPASPAAREKMTPEELADRMEKIRLQNEKIKERRQHVKADEEAFNTSVAAERAKQAANRKVQAQINQNREQNAKRKMEKIGNREWDSGKQDGEWKQSKRPTEDKGRGSSFTLAGADRDPGAPRKPTANRSTPKALSKSPNEPTERPLRDAAPHAAQKEADSSQTEAQDSGKQD